LIVAQGHDHPLLYHPGLEAARLHWVADAPPGEPPLECLARIRHRQPPLACRILELNGDRCRVQFAEPQRAIAPGQSIVFYRDDECLGGAVIEKALN
jgi:tRNA-specific 2-thiouridylase